MESLLDISENSAILTNGKYAFHSLRRYSMKNRLEELRRQRGITQEELADALSVSRQTVGSLENGRYNPSILLAFKIANYFRVAIEEVFMNPEETENEE